MGTSFVGCPTRTVLGPLLFSLYINYISTDIESEIRHLADDCVCYREIRDAENSLKLQKDIDRLGCWARKWVRRFQPVKCNIIIIIIRFLINVQVQGQHPHQWAPFQTAGLLHAWQISHQISRYVYHEG